MPSPALAFGKGDELVADPSAEIVNVKYRGPVDLASFSCVPTARSSFIERVCHNQARREMIVSLKGTNCAYCNVPSPLVNQFLSAELMGRFYNAQVKGRFGYPNPFD